MVAADMTTILHISDLHFGKPAVLEQIDAVDATIATGRFDMVAVSGDLSQRSRSGEFQRAAVFLREARKYSPVICIPGNHDVAWWYAPLLLGEPERRYENYRKYISHELEPVLHVPGVTIVGINTSHGVTPRTLTWNVRDISIIGDVTPEQLLEAERKFETAKRAGERDVRIAMMHHNPVKGDLSQRFGLKHNDEVLRRLGAMGVSVVLCGHDHQEAITYVEQEPNGVIVSTAGTLSDRSRGGRPSSYNVIEIGPDTIGVETYVWTKDVGDFVVGPRRCFGR